MHIIISFEAQIVSLEVQMRECFQQAPIMDIEVLNGIMEVIDVVPCLLEARSQTRMCGWPLREFRDTIFDILLELLEVFGHTRSGSEYLVFEIEDTDDRYDQVYADDEQTHRRKEDDRLSGDEAEKPDDGGVYEKYECDGEGTEYNRAQEAHATVEIEIEMTVVPPFRMKELLEQP